MCNFWVRRLAGLLLAGAVLATGAAIAQSKLTYSFEAIVVRVENDKLMLKSPKTKKELDPLTIPRNAVIQRNNTMIRLQDLQSSERVRITKEGEKGGSVGTITKIEVISS